MVSVVSFPQYSGTCSTDDNVVQMDLNLAKLLHQKWKESIQVSTLKQQLS